MRHVHFDGRPYGGAKFSAEFLISHTWPLIKIIYMSVSIQVLADFTQIWVNQANLPFRGSGKG